MSNDVAAQLHLRVECAIHLVDHGYLDDAAPSIPEGEVLELLLIDFWIGKGIEWTASRYGPPPTN